MVNSLQSWLAGAVTSEKLIAALAEKTGGGAPAGFAPIAGVLQSFICSIPQALAAAYAIGKHPASRRATTFVVGQVLYYLLDDDDLLPDTAFGALGLVDDAYFVHSAVARLIGVYPFVDASAANYIVPDKQAFQVVRTLLPAGIADALDRTCSDLVHLANTLFGGPVTGETPASQVVPILRVGEAIAVLSGS